MIVLILAAVPLMSQVPVERWRQDDSVAIKLSGRTVADGLGHLAIGNDSAWNYSIARDGYERRPFDTSKQANWTFFPLHPLMWKSAASVTGEWIWSGIVLETRLARTRRVYGADSAGAVADGDAYFDGALCGRGAWCVCGAGPVERKASAVRADMDDRIGDVAGFACDVVCAWDQCGWCLIC
ncbi:hypothetical protein KK141_15990 [Dyella sp. LX-66]|uniref:hypothetical protein n=1 Tax=unclassified Dyella TaxID=2634549 RepID=UPI001BE045B4|nr:MULTISPECIES: hypothetical protein [unclassified Dyella]MBT2118700.1 hypothetical protein [Dyella sp. LX-1]MBT2141049.1 hypothetical protein [Dyella sp. LX-66]